MTPTIEHRVIQIVAKTTKISPEDVQLDQLIEDVCEDSLDQVNLLFELEDEFDVDIPDEARESKTIQDIVLGIEKLMQAKEKQEVEVS